MARNHSRAERPRVRAGRLFMEAVDGVLSRPLRSLLTASGTLVGVACLVAVLGVTATANAQIAETFDAQTSTQVTVSFQEGEAPQRFPASAERSLRRLAGVIAVGTYATTSGMDLLVRQGGEQLGARVSGVSPGFWEVARPELVEGRLIDESNETFPVAVVGQRIADELGGIRVEQQPILNLGGYRFVVVGIIASAEREEVTATSITIPQEWVRENITPEQYSESLAVVTDVGAGQMIAEQAALALDPYDPRAFEVRYPASPTVLADAVSADLRSLFILLGGICVLVGGIGIANVYLISVYQRVPEIGLRRAIGARRRHVVYQFLLEAAILGTLGGLAGGAVGQAVVVVASLAQDWTPTLSPMVGLAAGPCGLVVGLLAGAYPALRASCVSPTAAFSS